MNAEDLRTVKQTVAECPWLTEPALRRYIFDSAQNGLAPALVRIGRRLLIHQPTFNAWLESHRGAA